MMEKRNLLTRLVIYYPLYYAGPQRCLLLTPISVSEPSKVHQFQLQTSRILLSMGVQKLNGPEISRFLPCMLQFLNSSRQLFIFSNYIREIDHFMLDLLERSDPILNSGLSEKTLIVDYPKEDHNEREFKRQIIGGIPDPLKK